MSSSMSLPGVEPGLRPSQSRVPPSHLKDKSLARDQASTRERSSIRTHPQSRTKNFSRDLRFQFHSPVRFAEKPGPAFDSHIMPSVQRLPGRTNRCLPQRHLRFGRRSIRLSLVTVQARQHTVLPRAGSTTRSGKYVIQSHFFNTETSVSRNGCDLGITMNFSGKATLPSAVLTRVSIAFVDIPSTECDHICRKTVIDHQRDHLRNANSKCHRLDEQFIPLGDHPGPVSPRVLLEVGWIDNLRPFRCHQRQ